MDRSTLQLREATVALVLLMSFLSSNAWGHGTPAYVDGSTGKLVVTGNVSNPVGYANQVFADVDPNAALTAIGGNRLFTDLPGFDVTDIEPNSGLWIEPTSRPDTTITGSPERWLWYWSASTETLASVPTGQQLQLVSARGFGSTTVGEFGAVPGSIQFMEPLNDDLGEHIHSLYYLVINASASAGQNGAYAFFARLTSPNYASSDPFLVALPSGLAASQVLEAAMDINQAALATQPGDFNGDGLVNLADYTVWRDHLGAADETLINSAGDGLSGVDGGDYYLWKANLGATTNAQSTTIATVPEPSTTWMLAVALVLAARVYHHRQS